MFDTVAMRRPEKLQDWDFRGADTKALTHGFHAYPAMMIPQIAARLLDNYGGGARLLLDPYCGTGTSLVEANARGISAVGADLNPLARLIAAAKTTRIPPEKTAQVWRRMQHSLLHDAAQQSGGAGACNAPDFGRMDFWFPKAVQTKLAQIKFQIERVREKRMRQFFWVAFSETVREASYTRNGEFKLYRMNAQQRARFKPDVFGIFAGKVERNIKGLRAFLAAAPAQAKTHVRAFNSVEGIPRQQVAPNSADIVVTSPPYGDSCTTVAYGQFSRLANEWLGFADAAAVDRKLMGGQKAAAIAPSGCAALDAALAEISRAHPLRAREICGFYRDYRRSIHNVAAALKPGGFACYVVGNRKVKGVVLPTDLATEAYFCESGFAREQVFRRNIPNKRMPSRNSPSNAPGASDVTMCREHIVVLRKRA